MREDGRVRCGRKLTRLGPTCEQDDEWGDENQSPAGHACRRTLSVLGWESCKTMRPIRAAHGWVAALVRSKAAQRSQDTTSQAAEIAPVLDCVKMERCADALTGPARRSSPPCLLSSRTRPAAARRCLPPGCR